MNPRAKFLAVLLAFCFTVSALAADIKFSGTVNAPTLTSGNVYDGGGTWSMGTDGKPKLNGAAVLKGRVNVAGDSKKVTLKNCRIEGHITMGDGSLYEDISIVWNEIIPTETAIKATIQGNRIIIEDNYIHDGDVWGCILWWQQDSSFSYNTLHMVHQGGHWPGNRNNIKINYNKFTGLKRAAIEIQTSNNAPGDGLDVIGNEGYDWYRPYNDAYLISGVPDRRTNVRIMHNYGRANKTGDWLNPNPNTHDDERFAYGLELGFQGGLVEGNTIIGPFTHAMVVSGAGGNHTQAMTLKDNKLFGYWTNFAGQLDKNLHWLSDESGPVVPPVQTNNIWQKEGSFPPPPGKAGMRLAGAPPIPPVPVPTLAAPAIAARSLGTSIELTVANLNAGSTTRIERKPGTGTWTPIKTMAASETKFTDSDFTPEQVSETWWWYYRAVAVKGGQESVPGQWKSAQLKPATPVPTPTPTPTPTTRPTLKGKLNIDGYQPADVELKPAA